MDIIAQKEIYLNSLYEEEQRLKESINALIVRFNDLNTKVGELSNKKEELIREQGVIINKTIQLEKETRQSIIDEIERDRKEVGVKMNELLKNIANNDKFIKDLSEEKAIYEVKKNDMFEKLKEKSRIIEELAIQEKQQKESTRRLTDLVNRRQIELDVQIKATEEAKRDKESAVRLREITEQECKLMIEKNNRDREVLDSREKELYNERVELNSLWEQLKNAKKE